MPGNHRRVVLFYGSPVPGWGRNRGCSGTIREASPMSGPLSRKLRASSAELAEAFPESVPAAPRLGSAFSGLNSASPNRGESGTVLEKAFPRFGTVRSTFGNGFPRFGEACPRPGNAFPTLGHPFPTFGIVFPSRGRACPKVGDGFPRRGRAGSGRSAAGIIIKPGSNRLSSGKSGLSFGWIMMNKAQGALARMKNSPGIIHSVSERICLAVNGKICYDKHNIVAFVNRLA